MNPKEARTLLLFEAFLEPSWVLLTNRVPHALCLAVSVQEIGAESHLVQDVGKKHEGTVEEPEGTLEATAPAPPAPEAVAPQAVPSPPEASTEAPATPPDVQDVEKVEEEGAKVANKADAAKLGVT